MSNNQLTEEYAALTMHNVIGLNTPEQLDSLQEVLKIGTQVLLRKAVKSELESCLAEHYALKTKDEYQKTVVRNGYLPERLI